MLNRKIIWGGIAIALSQSITPGYSMEQTYNTEIRNIRTNQRLSVTVVPGKQWATVIQKLEVDFGVGNLVFAGKEVRPDDEIPNDFGKLNFTGVAFFPSARQVIFAKTLEPQAMQLMGSNSENDTVSGSILMAFSQIKSAMDEVD